MNQSCRTRDKNADFVLLVIFDFFFRKSRKAILLLLLLPLMLPPPPPPPPPKATTDNVDMTETPSKTKPAAAAAERTSASTARPLGIRYFFFFS